MVLLIVGAFLLALGLFSGVVLVVAPLGLATWSPGVTLWVLFPLFSIIGYTLFVIGAKTTQIRMLSLGVSCLLLLLALVSAAALVMASASVVEPVDSTLSLWYVLVIAGVLGAIGAASSQRESNPV